MPDASPEPPHKPLLLLRRQPLRQGSPLSALPQQDCLHIYVRWSLRSNFNQTNISVNNGEICIGKSSLLNHYYYWDVEIKKWKMFLLLLFFRRGFHDHLILIDVKHYLPGRPNLCHEFSSFRQLVTCKPKCKNIHVMFNVYFQQIFVEATIDDHRNSHIISLMYWTLTFKLH